MPPVDPPQATILIPNTQPIYCQFQPFCRGGVAQYLLARGPARNLWVPLCQHCAESMARTAPDRLIRVTVDGAVERGAVRFVQEPLLQAGQPLWGPSPVEALLTVPVAANAYAEPIASPDAPPTTPPPICRADVLAHLAAYADDPELLDAIAQIFGDGDAGEPTDNQAPAHQPAPGAPAPVEAEKPAAGKTPAAKGSARKPARKPGRR